MKTTCIPRHQGTAGSFLVPALVMTLLAGVLSSCDATAPEPETPDLQGDEIALQIDEIVLTTLDGRVVAYSHDDHWHGVVRLTEGEQQPLLAYLVPPDAGTDGHSVPPDSSWFTLEAWPEHHLRVTASETDVVVWQGDRHEFMVQAGTAGSSLTTFTVLHSPQNTTLYVSPSTAVVVTSAAP